MSDAGRARSRRCCSSRPSRSRPAELAEALRGDRGGGRARRSTGCDDALRRAAGVVLREVAGGWTLASHPDAEEAARRLLAKPRTPPLTPAQAETLAIVAYLQPVSRPEVARIRGVAVGVGRRRAGRARADRGGGPLAVRRRPLPHHAAVPEAVRAAHGSTSCPTSRSGTRAPRRPGGAARAAAARRASARGTERARPALARRGWLRGELAAGGVDVAAAGQADGRAQAVLLERGPEGVDRLARRALVGRVGRVVRDQVDLVDPRVEQLGELRRACS